MEALTGALRQREIVVEAFHRITGAAIHINFFGTSFGNQKRHFIEGVTLSVEEAESLLKKLPQAVDLARKEERRVLRRR